MTPYLLSLLADPLTGERFNVVEPLLDQHGNFFEGKLRGVETGSEYPIINGIPRFISGDLFASAEAFGDEWNYFNFVQFKENWLKHTVFSTWGGVDVFKGKIIVDAGGGSGAQTKWFLEYGAKHVILLDLSGSLDDVAMRNMVGCDPRRYDFIQCSIDSPPLAKNSVPGIVYCHNVIQHTPSVEKTADALYGLLAAGGELVFNCYGKNTKGLFRFLRWYLCYLPVREVLRRSPFWLRLLYSRMISFLRQIPILGILLEKAMIVFQGDIPVIPGETHWSRLKRSYRCSVLNTFDMFGGHHYQWHKTNREIINILDSFDPRPSRVENFDAYFSKTSPPGCALRVFR